jgi:two-component system chemotaxis response regulator CheY
MRALVVDDSRAIRLCLGRMLRQAGFTEVVEASNGREAMERLGEMRPPDLALVDWNMPEMDGYTLIRAVRAVKRYASMRLMMVTTETEIEQVVKALNAGADEYVMKPFTSEVLQSKLELLGFPGTG